MIFRDDLWVPNCAIKPEMLQFCEHQPDIISQISRYTDAGYTDTEIHLSI